MTHAPHVPASSARASIAPWRHGARGAVSLNYDDGTDSAFEFAVAALARHRVPGTFFLCPGWHRNEPEKLRRWQVAAARHPEVFLGNHTWSHCGARDALQLADEVRRGDEAVRRLLATKPGYRDYELLPFGIPGGVPWNVTENELAAVLAERRNVLRHDAGGNFGAEPSRGEGFSDHAGALAILDRAERDGSWQTLLFHGVGGDWFLFPAADHERIVRDIALRQARGSLWAAPTLDIHQYAVERDAATLASTAGADGSLSLRLDIPTDAVLYDMPLSIQAIVPADWQSARITAGDASWRVAADAGHLLFEVPPVSADIAVCRDR